MSTTVGTIGARIRYWRLRRHGMTQNVLAGLAGVPQSYISQVESGKKVVDSRSTLVAIAAALKVTVADLLGQPGDPTDPLKAGADEAIPAIWAALIEVEEGERRTPSRTPEQLVSAITYVDDLRSRADCAAIAGLLPTLLTDAAAHGRLYLTQAGYQTSTCLRQLGYRHLALSAARIAVSAASEAGDPAWIGASKFAYTLALPIEAAGLASRAADRAIGELQAGAAAVEVRQMLGQLHLSAALACTVDCRPDDGQAHLAAAAQEAATLGDPADGAGFNRSCFGPTNVGLWRMAVASELGEHGRVIELAEGLRPDRLRHVNRHQSYWLAVGRAFANTGRDHEALAALIRAERAAPVVFALNPQAQDVVVSMVSRARRRSVSEDLRILARRLGIEA